jgi:toxin ParE1/3/4
MILRRPRAIAAMIELAEYIGQDSPASADRFMDSVEATFSYLESTPAIGRPYESDDSTLTNVRTWRVQGFPNHLIFYRQVPQGVEVLTVMHGARDIGTALKEEF